LFFEKVAVFFFIFAASEGLGELGIGLLGNKKHRPEAKKGGDLVFCEEKQKKRKEKTKKGE
jgi:hypothetical protein